MDMFAFAIILYQYYGEEKRPNSILSIFSPGQKYQHFPSLHYLWPLLTVVNLYRLNLMKTSDT